MVSLKKGGKPVAGNYWDRITTNRVARRRLLRSGAALSVGAAALALVGCGSDDGGDAPAGGPAATTAPGAATAPEPTATQEVVLQHGDYLNGGGTPEPGGHFVIRRTATANFNPVSNWDDGTNTGGAHVFDRPLTSREDDRRFVLEAMESIELPDDTTVIMKLVPNQVFHDFPPVNGRPFVASDVVASQDYISELPNAFDRTFQNDFLDFAEAPDDQTAIYHLLKPNAYLFSQNMLGSGTGQPIMAPETLPNIDTGKQIGTGPYFLDEAQLSVSHIYKKFPQFRLASQGMPYIESREIKFLPDTQATEAAFRGGQIDLWAFPDVTQFKSIPPEMGDRAQTASLPGFSPFHWHMNTRPDSVGGAGFEWRRDKRRRQAFWRLTNRQQMLSLGYADDGVLPNGILPAGLLAYQLNFDDIKEFYREDVEEAVKLLAASNFDLDRTWDMMAWNSGSSTDAVGQVWQQQLLRANIKTKISNTTGSAQLFQRWTDNDWEIMVQGSPGTDTPGQALRLQHSDSWSDTYRGFALYDPEIDALIEKSEATVDFEENLRLVTEVQMFALREASPSMLLLTSNFNQLLSGVVRNFELTQVRPVYWHDMWLKQ